MGLLSAPPSRSSKRTAAAMPRVIGLGVSSLLLLLHPCTAFLLPPSSPAAARSAIVTRPSTISTATRRSMTFLTRGAANGPDPLSPSSLVKEESAAGRLWASVPDKKVRGGGSMTSSQQRQQEADEVHPYRDAITKTAISIAMAIAFGAGVWATKGPDSGIEYYAGYLVEQSLSVDNLFVFVVLFEYFKVPTEFQNRVLTWGIIGAMTMRALMVFAGVEALDHFKGVLLIFAGVLVFSSFKLLGEGIFEDEEEESEDLADNAIISLAKKMVNTVDYYDGSKFFTTTANGLRVATPLLLVLVCIELSDVVFAIDSVPAVFGVTKDPFIVYTSNIFAILGLRSLYTVLANAMVDLPYLKPAVALILGFVGAKLGAEYFGYEVSNVMSLGVIMSLLGGGVGASLRAKNKL